MVLRGEEVTEKNEEPATLDGLPWDLVLHISRRLPDPRDRLSFRAVNRLLRSAMSPPSLTDSLKEQRACLSDPWLLSCRKNMDHNAYTLIDPLRGDKYFMTLPSTAMIIYCNGSWCVMAQPTRSIFLLNPFTKEKITLPECPDEWTSIKACAFMNSPHSPDFILVLLCICHETDHKVNVYIDIFQQGEWSSDMAFKWMSELKQHPDFQSELCVSNGVFWLLDGSHDETTWVMGQQDDHFPEIEWDNSELPTFPYYKRSYLLQCGTDLLAVLTGMSEDDDVQVFKFDDLDWVAVDNLDEFVLYISHFSSFSRHVTTPGEGNKIYFPSLYDGKLVYYSLHSKRYHCVEGGEPISSDTTSSGGFQQGTEEQILHAWIQPRWF